MSTKPHMLERYAERGKPRGADSVLEGARGEGLADYVPSRRVQDATQGHRSRALLVAASVGILALAGVLVQRTASQDSVQSYGAPETVAPVTTVVPTPAEIEAAEKKRAELMASGWVMVDIDPVIVGDAVPGIGYRRAINAGGSPYGQETVKDSAGVERTPVWDAPDGQVIGYRYPNLGFVSKATGDKPSFDALAIYRSRGECEPLDQTCIREQNARFAPGTDPQLPPRR